MGSNYILVSFEIIEDAEQGRGVAVAEWPISAVESGLDHRNEPVPEGRPVRLSKVREPDGATSYLVQCPRCGVAGYCQNGRWTISGEGDNLTFSPSTLCNSTARTDGPNGRCGGYYWLTDGVLREA